MAAMEDKIGDGTSLEYIYISLLDEKTWYLEGRGKRGENPALVATPLQIDPQSKVLSLSLIHI